MMLRVPVGATVVHVTLRRARKPRSGQTLAEKFGNEPRTSASR
jgi:hypothetical protein